MSNKTKRIIEPIDASFKEVADCLINFQVNKENKKIDINDFKNKIICGDCIKILKTIPSLSISGCITDPPYNYEIIGQDWDENEAKRRISRIKASSTLVKNIPYGSGLSGGTRNERWYKRNRENTISYDKWVEEWGKELLRILKPGAFVFVFNSSRTVAHIQVALENVGFYARDILVWKRNSGIPKGLNFSKKLEKMGDSNSLAWSGWHSCLRNEWEGIALLQKPLQNNYTETVFNFGVGLLKAQEKDGFLSNIIQNVEREKIDGFNNHPTVKPLKLIEKLLSISIPQVDSNIVIDPFNGSGTTSLAAKNLGISYIGIDKSNDYCEIARKRLAQ